MLTSPARLLRCFVDRAHTHRIPALAHQRRFQSDKPRNPDTDPAVRYLRKSEERRKRAQGFNDADEEDRRPSLLEELFPLETQSSSQPPRVSLKPKREIPRRPLDVVGSTWFGPAGSEDLDADEPRVGQDIREGLPARPASARKEAQAAQRHLRQYRDSTVLVLKSAGKHLCEDDFRRAIPGGSHIEGWAASGSLLKVIRGRDKHTLAPNGEYYILFGDATAASAYLRHAHRLHEVCQAFNPTDPSRPAAIPPPPLPSIPEPRASVPASDNSPFNENPVQAKPTAGLAFPHGLKNTSRHSAMQSYTLIPPSQRLELAQIKQPYSPLLRQILNLGGYEKLVSDRLSEYEVLLSVAEGHQLDLSSIRHAILRDGRERGLRWCLVGRRGGGGVREISGGHGSDVKEAGDEGQIEKGRKLAWKKWILSFAEGSEARRFVSMWHRREIGLNIGERPGRRVESLVDAEVVF